MPQCGINTAVLVSMVAIGLDATLPIDHGWFYGKPNAKGISQAKWFVPVVLFTKVIFGVTTLLLITWESKLPSVPGSLLGMLPDGSWTAIFLIAYANLSANMLFTLYMKDHDRARAATQRSRG